MDSLSRAFISQRHREGKEGKVQPRTLTWKKCAFCMCPKTFTAVTAGAGRGGDYMCCRRLEFATAQSHCNLSLFGHVLPFPKPKAVCTPERGSSGVF